MQNLNSMTSLALIKVWEIGLVEVEAEDEDEDVEVLVLHVSEVQVEALRKQN